MNCIEKNFFQLLKMCKLPTDTFKIVHFLRSCCLVTPMFSSSFLAGGLSIYITLFVVFRSSCFDNAPGSLMLDSWVIQTCRGIERHQRQDKNAQDEDKGRDPIYSMNLQYQTNCQKNITKILTSFEQKAFVEVSGKFNNQIFSTKEKFFSLPQRFRFVFPTID